MAKKSLIVDGKINQDLAEAASGRSDRGLSNTSKAEQHGSSRRTSKTKRIKQRHHDQERLCTSAGKSKKHSGEAAQKASEPIA